MYIYTHIYISNRVIFPRVVMQKIPRLEFRDSLGYFYHRSLSLSHTHTHTHTHTHKSVLFNDTVHWKGLEASVVREEM